ncbi:hypothetical protein RUM44_010797 [Polyplax serrata]|uniref:Uncharacterized protein n=1 Tax=Polyplax serrata TaxID=468196 RepID=A0ABR1ANB9_POLSC
MGSNLNRPRTHLRKLRSWQFFQFSGRVAKKFIDLLYNPISIVFTFETGFCGKIVDCKKFITCLSRLLQIPRSDPCEMCVCVDAQMYCFWKICTSHGSATTTVAMTPSEMSNSHHQTLIDKLSEEDEKLNEIVEINEKYSKILTDQRKYNILKKMETTSVRSVGTSEETSPPTTTTTTKTTTTTTTTSTTEPVVCYVMGE